MEWTERRVGNVVIVDLKGQLTVGHQGIEPIIGDLLGRGEKRILFNMAEVKYMDSTSVGDLVVAYNQASSAGARLKLLSLPSRIRELLTIHHIIDVFEHFADEAKAVDSFTA